MSENIRLLYLTWGESIIGNGIFNNQVFNQLVAHKKSSSNLNITLVAGLPLFNKKVLFSPIAYYHELLNIKERCNANDIEFKFRFLVVFNKWFYSKTWQLPFFHLFHKSFFKRLIIKNRISIIHCRSYHAAHFCYLQKTESKLNCKVIFDTRSQFPEEGVMLNSYTQSSKHYINWKNIEKQLLDNCEAVVTVSDTIKKGLNKISPSRNILQISTSTDTEIFSRDNEKRKQLRDKFRISENEKVLAYIGDLNDYGWHRTDNLLSLYKAFNKCFINTKLFIITNSYHEPILNKVIKAQFFENTILVSSKSSVDTSALLNCGDYAALSYKDVNNELEKTIANGILASKTGEYLAMKLPVLVNKTVGAASELIAKYNIGLVYEAGHENNIEEELISIEKEYIKIAEDARNVAVNNFSSILNSNKYLHLYNTI